MMRYLLALGMLAIAMSGLRAEETVNWPQFRGPGARGVAEGKGLPATWSTTKSSGMKSTTRVLTTLLVLNTNVFKMILGGMRA